MADKYLFLVPDRKAASARYRVLQFLPLAEAEGFSCEVREIPKSLRERSRLFRHASDFRKVLIHRKLFQPWELFSLRRRANKILFDYDDAILFRDTQDPTHRSRWREFQFARTLGSVERVLAGNRYLADLAARFSTGGRIEVIPTAVDVKRYPLKETKATSDVTIGWIGSRSTLRYLDSIRPALEAIGQAKKGLSLKVVADESYALQALRVENRLWSEETEIGELLSFDIGISPLPDDPWTRGKCGLKILQYQAAGLPVVSSPVGANQEIVSPGKSGLFASTIEEWIRALLSLADNAELRARMGKAGRASVEKRYSIDAVWPALRAALAE